MREIGPKVIVHRLNDDINITEKMQARRTFNPERYLAMNEEVEKLLTTNFILETKYPKWVNNMVMVKKSNGKWRIYIDYKDLNKTYNKDCFANQIGKTMEVYMDDMLVKRI